MALVKHPDLNPANEGKPSPYTHHIFGGSMTPRPITIEGGRKSADPVAWLQINGSVAELSERQLDELINNLQWFQKSIYPVSSIEPPPTRMNRLKEWMPMFRCLVDGDAFQFNHPKGVVYVNYYGDDAFEITGTVTPMALLGIAIVQEFFRQEKT